MKTRQKDDKNCPFSIDNISKQYLNIYIVIFFKYFSELYWITLTVWIVNTVFSWSLHSNHEDFQNKIRFITCEPLSPRKFLFCISVRLLKRAPFSRVVFSAAFFSLSHLKIEINGFAGLLRHFPSLR